MHSVLTSRVILHLHIAAAGEDTNARTVSLPVFARRSGPEIDTTTLLTTSLEAISVPPSAGVDTGSEIREQGESLKRE